MTFASRLLLFLFFGPLLFPVSPPCALLPPGHTAQASASSVRPACFIVDAADGEGIQVIAQQPEDLTVHFAGAGRRVLADSFAFGPETATLIGPGRFRIEIAVADSIRSPVSFTMSRKRLPLQQALRWREAENAGTDAKVSGKLASIQDALKIWTDLGDLLSIARTRLEEGDALLGPGDYGSARTAYEEGLNLCRAAGDLRCEAEAVNNAGYTDQNLGDFEPALRRLNEARDAWKRLGETRYEAFTLSNLGQLYWYTNDFQRAIGFFDRAANVLRGRDPLVYGQVLNNLGLCYQSLAEYGAARSYFQRALALEATLPAARKDRVHARLNLGRNLMLQGSYQAAEAVLQQAVAEGNALAYRPGLADAQSNLGQVLFARHEVVRARNVLEQALKLHEVLGNKRMQAVDLHYLGLAEFAGGNTGAARELLTRALQIRRQCALREAVSDTLLALAVLERDAGNPQAARSLVEQALAILELVRSQVPGPALRASYYSRKRRFFDLLLDLDMAQGNPHAVEDGLLAVERGTGRALLDMLSEEPLLGKLPEDLEQRRRRIEDRLGLLSYRLSNGTSSRESAVREQVERLIAEDEEVEARIRENAAGGMGQPLTDIEALQRTALPPGTALLEYHMGEERGLVWLVTRDRVQVFPLPRQSAVDRDNQVVISLFGRILDRRRSTEKQAEFAGALRRLSHTLLDPLRDQVLPERLIIVPDGTLHQTPFAALTLPGSGRRLGLAHDLLQVPAASYLIAAREPRDAGEFPATFLGIADPVFSATDPRVSGRKVQDQPATELARLSFTGEFDTITKLVPRSRRVILSGFKASAAALEKSRLEDFAILHFSTHALIDDRIPELSRIALSLVDPTGHPVAGFLHPYQLARLKLNGQTVVLSACQTALGKQVIGEGLIGLTASLFHAGAARLVVTLSEIDAEASAEFLSHTYQHFLGARPVRLEHALTLARREAAASERWSDPYYWASFLVVSRPSR